MSIILQNLFDSRSFDKYKKVVQEDKTFSLNVYCVVRGEIKEDLFVCWTFSDVLFFLQILRRYVVWLKIYFSFLVYFMFGVKKPIGDRLSKEVGKQEVHLAWFTTFHRDNECSFEFRLPSDFSHHSSHLFSQTVLWGGEKDHVMCIDFRFSLAFSISSNVCLI